MSRHTSRPSAIQTSALGLSLDTLETSHKASWSEALTAKLETFITTNRNFIAFLKDLDGRNPTITRLRDFDLTEIRPVIGCDVPEYRRTKDGRHILRILDEKIRYKIAKTWEKLNATASINRSRSQSVMLPRHDAYDESQYAGSPNRDMDMDIGMGGRQSSPSVVQHFHGPAFTQHPTSPSPSRLSTDHRHRSIRQSIERNDDRLSAPTRRSHRSTSEQFARPATVDSSSGTESFSSTLSVSSSEDQDQTSSDFERESSASSRERAAELAEANRIAWVREMEAAVKEQDRLKEKAQRRESRARAHDRRGSKRRSVDFDLPLPGQGQSSGHGRKIRRAQTPGTALGPGFGEMGAGLGGSGKGGGDRERSSRTPPADANTGLKLEFGTDNRRQTRSQSKGSRRDRSRSLSNMSPL